MTHHRQWFLASLLSASVCMILACAGARQPEKTPPTVEVPKITPSSPPSVPHGEPVEDGKPKSPPKSDPQPTWSSPDKAVQLGDIQVQIEKVVIGKVPLTDAIQGNAVSAEDLLMVELTIRNLSPTKKLEYHSWIGRDLSFSRDYAALKDNFSNVYSRISFGLLDHVTGSVKEKTIYPGNPVTDVLVFQKPLDSSF